MSIEKITRGFGAGIEVNLDKLAEDAWHADLANGTRLAKAEAAKRGIKLDDETAREVAVKRGQQGDPNFFASSRRIAARRTQSRGG